MLAVYSFGTFYSLTSEQLKIAFKFYRKSEREREDAGVFTLCAHYPADLK
jgi:hypothetical protein